MPVPPKDFVKLGHCRQKRLEFSTMKIIYIAGIDGSGKTTLAKNLETRLQKTDSRARYFYARHFPIFMKPLKLLARATLLGKTSEFGNYEGYIAEKKSQGRKHRWLARVYAFAWLFDYCVITYVRLLPHIIARHALILDRYFFDVAINISITLDLSEEEFLRQVEATAKFYPSPDAVFFLDLPAEVAFRRKTDIQSVQYLEERRERYLSLVKKHHWIIVDACASPEQVETVVSSHLANGNR
jgi:thymidylate kinase